MLLKKQSSKEEALERLFPTTIGYTLQHDLILPTEPTDMPMLSLGRKELVLRCSRARPQRLGWTVVTHLTLASSLGGAGPHRRCISTSHPQTDCLPM